MTDLKKKIAKKVNQTHKVNARKVDLTVLEYLYKPNQKPWKVLPAFENRHNLTLKPGKFNVIAPCGTSVEVDRVELLNFAKAIIKHYE